MVGAVVAAVVGGAVGASAAAVGDAGGEVGVGADWLLHAASSTLPPPTAQKCNSRRLVNGLSRMIFPFQELIAVSI
jgi:hypothetical protein